MDTKEAKEESALEIVHRFVIDTEHQFQPFAKQRSQGFLINLADPRFRGAAVEILEGREQFICYIDFREKALEPVREQVAEFITRVNSDLFNGNFEMNYDQGSLCFKTGLDFSGTRLPYSIVEHIFNQSLQTVEHFWPALVDVMSGAKTAEEAIDLGE